MRISNDWSGVVLKCDTSKAKKTLVEFYRFIASLKGVQSLHFLIRDRVEDGVILCFRIMVKSDLKETIKGKAASNSVHCYKQTNSLLTPTLGLILHSTLFGLLKRELGLSDQASLISSLLGIL